MLNDYLYGDWNTGLIGILLRSSDGDSPSQFNGQIQATYMHASIKAPNPSYPSIATPLCPSPGQCNDNSKLPGPICGGDNDVAWNYATLTRAYARKWNFNYRANSVHQGYYTGGNIDGVDNIDTPTFYFSDSNSLDERKTSGGQEAFTDRGRGCHNSQNFGCTGSKKGPVECMTYDSLECRCAIANDPTAIDPTDYGKQAGQSVNRQSGAAHNPGLQGYNTLYPTCPNNSPKNKRRSIPQGKKVTQPMFLLDYISCWFGIEDLSSNNGYMKWIVQGSNSMWEYQDEWWNHRLPYEGRPGYGYWGWNEVVASGNIEDDVPNFGDAHVIVLPTLENVQDPSLCYLSSDAINNLEQQLIDQWYDPRWGMGGLPVVIMSQVRGVADTAFCNDYWDGKDCTEGWKKTIFSQNFKFPGQGWCLRVPLAGGDEVYFFKYDEPECTTWGAPSYC